MTDYTTVKRILVAKRLMDHQGVTSKPKPRHCHRCRAAVIAAIDDIGATVALDPTPTTAAGELAAVVAGARTFTVWPDRIVRRADYVIKRFHPDECDVHVIHQCGMPPPERNDKRMRRTSVDIFNPTTPPPF